MDHIGAVAPAKFDYFAAVIAIGLLIGVLLLPQGVGFRVPFEFPRLDLPRLSTLGLFTIVGIYLMRNPKRFEVFQIAPRTFALFAFITVWQIVSAVTVSTGIWSYYWAFGNFVAFWGFAIAFVILAGHREYCPLVVRVLITVGVILALWSALEFITQAKLVTYRNLYDGDPSARGFSYIMRRRIHGMDELPYMSLGPYYIHHVLAAVLCALGGFLIVGPDKRSPIWYFLGSLLLTFSILSTQSRAGFVAFIVLIMMCFYFLKSWRSRLAMLGGGVVALALFVPLFGGMDNFKIAFMHQIFGSSFIMDIFSGVQAGSQDVRQEVSILASAQGRIAGLFILFSQIDQWWLFGTGPGSMVNQERFTPTIVSYSDQGSFIWFMVESGLPFGIALAIAIAASLYQGLRSKDWWTRSAAVGVGSFWVFSLIQVGLPSWGIAMILTGLIEAWSRHGESSAAAKPAAA